MAEEQLPLRAIRARVRASRGLTTMIIALAAVLLAGLLFAPSSVSWGALQGALPFAAVLAIVALGQTLVVMQGGIDLSVAGAISLGVVIVSHEAYGDNARLLPAIALALLAAVLAGVLNGILVALLRMNAIVATLGTNALLYAVVLGISGGTPRQTTSLMAHIAGGTLLGVPNSIYVAVVVLVVVTLIVKRTVSGRRFEAVGANPRAARIVNINVQRHVAMAYVGAQVLYWVGAVLLAGIINKPSAFQGDTYLLSSVAAVVLGGTSLLGGRGYLVESALAALFLTQLEQLVLALGASYAVQTLTQAVAFAVGVALYTIPWSELRALVRRRRTRSAET